VLDHLFAAFALTRQALPAPAMVEA
jgi:hypothetical protein